MKASHDIDILYVPADCGSLIPGKSKAPKAFRDTELPTKLQQAGVKVNSARELDIKANYATSELGLEKVRNLKTNLDVCDGVYAMVKANQSAGQQKVFQLILGGECCMLPPIMSALWHISEQGERVGLIYIDADLDLASPTNADSTEFIASMTGTHLLGLNGHLSQMRRYSRDLSHPHPDGKPVCDASNMTFFGTNMSSASNTRENFTYLFDQNFNITSSVAVAANPEASARNTLQFIEDRVDQIVVHLDVDSIDPRMFPLANVPSFTGVSFEKMMLALQVFLSSEKVTALVVAEVNPDHDPTLALTNKLTDNIVRMLGARKGWDGDY